MSKNSATFVKMFVVTLAYLYIGGMGLFRWWGWPDFESWLPLERSAWWFLGHAIAGVTAAVVTVMSSDD